MNDDPVRNGVRGGTLLRAAAVVSVSVFVASGPRSSSVKVDYANLRARPTPLATSRHLSARTVTVTQADSGKSFRMHRGDQLVVELSGPSVYTWTEPTSSKQGVLQRISGSEGSDAGATFVAAKPGRSSVLATDNPNCYPECLPPSLLFEVGVSVSR